MTSNKNCGIVYTRKQEPNSSLKGEAERQRKAVHHRRCNKRSKLDFNGLSFLDHRSKRQTVNALHSLRNIKQAARNSGRSKQTRKERVPWAHWISRVVAIGSAVYSEKRIRLRTKEPYDHSSMIYIR